MVQTYRQCLRAIPGEFSGSDLIRRYDAIYPCWWSVGDVSVTCQNMTVVDDVGGDFMTDDGT